jgi:hypothetical protein
MRQILVVANQTLGGAQFIRTIADRLAGGDRAFYVVVPATAVADQIVPQGGGTSLTKAPTPREHARAVAEQRLNVALAAIRGAGGEGDGEVGAPDPLEAVRDAISHQQVDEVIVSTLPLGLSKWIRRDLPHQVERLTGLPVTHIIDEAAGR